MYYKSSIYVFISIAIIGFNLVHSKNYVPENPQFEEVRQEIAHKYGLVKDFELLNLESLSEISEGKSKRSCPNSCSGNGYCINNACNCNTGYYGSDCSLTTKVLTSGKTVYNQTVSTFQWNYYSIVVTGSNHDVFFIVNQTVSSGDCDDYVQLNSFPTRTIYLKRDITTDKSVKISIINAAAGTYYLGVYGFQTSQYTVTSYITGLCPNGCSNHGSCISGTCTCYPGYAGSDCSYPVTSMTIGNTYTGDLTKSQWKYFSYNLQSVSSGTMLNFVSSSSSAQADCDLYLKLGQIPSIMVWDFANVTVSQQSSIRVTNPQSGTWYLGVYGFTACDYSLSLTTSTSCPNACSNRGTCNSQNVCACNAGYTGNYCQTRTAPLTNGDTDNGYVKYNLWNYYTYTTDSADNFVITITQQNANADCDLYVKAGQNPTKLIYDFQDISQLTTYSLTIEDPGHITWYIGIFGWQECTYSINTIESGSCTDPTCSGNGDCDSDTGTCICDSGFTGDSCQYILSPLDNGNPTSDFVSYNSWKFYSFSINSSALYIVLKETDSSGLIWVYVDRNYPTLRQYLYSDTQTNTNTHVIAIELDNPETTTYQIGVYSNPYNLPGENTEYQIVAWSPNL